ncbi:DNA-directed RNA polymerase II large [Babesia ovis]|uniref:DNA-directed RNA polymerase II large n=1 Tax=Babesia ovis TaxID=5869 RepID=A0A9W5TF47_BABOV|nr:DNA-directed RNA polymerase II large [Babesia ovis]
MKKQQVPIESISLDKLNEDIIDGKNKHGRFHLRAATIEKCGTFANGRILAAIKQRWTEVLRQRIDAVNRGEQFTHLDSLTTSHYHVPEDLPKHMDQPEPAVSEFSDNEFDDAEVESAHPQQTLDSDAVIAGMAKETVVPEQKTNGQPEETTDTDDDLSISDISDLDDKEPETKDVVIGILDKVSRPSSKKTSTPMWRVKLKYGILQVNGVEVPFDNLEGEFEF